MRYQTRSGEEGLKTKQKPLSRPRPKSQRELACLKAFGSHSNGQLSILDDVIESRVQQEFHAFGGFQILGPTEVPWLFIVLPHSKTLRGQRCPTKRKAC